MQAPQPPALGVPSLSSALPQLRRWSRRTWATSSPRSSRARWCLCAPTSMCRRCEPPGRRARGGGGWCKLLGLQLGSPKALPRLTLPTSICYPNATEQGDSGHHGRHPHPRQPAHAAAPGGRGRSRGGDLAPGGCCWLLLLLRLARQRRAYKAAAHAEAGQCQTMQRDGHCRGAVPEPCRLLAALPSCAAHRAAPRVLRRRAAWRPWPRA